LAPAAGRNRSTHPDEAPTEERRDSVVRWSETRAYDQDNLDPRRSDPPPRRRRRAADAPGEGRACPSGYRGSGGYCASMSDRGPLLANAQGLNPYYGPDGQVYNRGGVTDDLAPVNRHMPNAKASIAGNGNAFAVVVRPRIARHMRLPASSCYRNFASTAKTKANANALITKCMTSPTSPGESSRTPLRLFAG
jgi:hypothetical protein